MPKIAWFTPLPPVRSGVAQYNVDLLPALSSAYEIDVFLDGRPDAYQSPDPAVRLFSAYDFVWRNRLHRYDLFVYQLGNASCHDYMWAYLARYPGLVVLHDGQLHHARARMLLQQRRVDDYRREFWYNHPDAKSDVAELGAAGLLGSMTYLFPMLRVVVESSRRLLVHNHWLAGQIRETYPGADVDVVEMGVREPSPHPDARSQIRSRHGIAADAVVFTAFGKVTPEKRLREVVSALPCLAATEVRAHLLLAGETVDYYDVLDEVKASGLEQMVTIAGYVADEDVDDYLTASDVCLCLRWPTSRETSASWRRCLAAGKPTISSDLVHTADIPMLDPRDGSLLSTRGKIPPVGMGVDIVDEVPCLALAIRRLATDRGLRETLGGNARSFWAENFRLDRMASGYRQAMDRALTAPGTPMRSPSFPHHLRSTGIEHAEMLVKEISEHITIPDSPKGIPR